MGRKHEGDEVRLGMAGIGGQYHLSCLAPEDLEQLFIPSSPVPKSSKPRRH